MATISELQKIQQEWQEHCRQIQSITDTKSLVRESSVQKEQRIRRLQKNYAAFCEYYFPHFLQLRDKATGETIRVVHNAPFHNAAANKVKNTPNLKAVFKWPRGHAKSTHMDIFTPLWLIFQPKRLIDFMVLVGKSEDGANRLLGDIQAELQYNKRIIADFGKQMSMGDWTEGEFTTKDGVHFLACGRGQSPRGLRKRESRPDYIVIDDLDDDELCRNSRRVREMTDWVKEALFGALDVGRGRFIMVGNLISKTSVLANICATKGVHVSTVYAVDGEGNPVWREKWTKEEARGVADFMGYRAWNKEMMHNPIVEGTVFKQEWIKYAKRPAWWEFDELVLYIDPSWKSKKTNDTKAAKLWGKCRSQLWHLRAFVRKASVAELVRWCYDLYEWSLEIGLPIRFMMEASFMQDILLDEFTTEGEIRGFQLPITGDTRKKPDKFQRVEAISPLWERGFVYYDISQKEDPDMQAGIEQTLAFEKGMAGNDDAPDADEGAIYILQKNTRQQIYSPRFGKRPTSKNRW
nr:MAG TPA: Large Terminase [Caudoviricetes sp.]